ncbi:ATP-dependent translocase ABCB1-like [Daktulosphaira vitifoliae]|uniref:ATP-dependent translocase ABCB1-like n=1 Tax=Daktulosphaira vitifoliae TaxID=58002 RepID=UPI0021AA8989|nr:ATP-dependent translocase ABCB1-like [Daktulosphaira vitifoliae]
MPSATYSVNQNLKNDTANCSPNQGIEDEIELPSIIKSSPMLPGISSSTLYINKFSMKSKLHDTSNSYLSFLRIFRYADKWDITLMVVGIIMSVATGSSLPVLAYFFGQMTNTFIRQTSKYDFMENGTSWNLLNVTSTNHETSSSIYSIPKLSPEEFDNYMTEYSLYYLYIAIIVLIAAYIQTWCWEMACERQVYRLRNVFFSQVIRQDITWFDTNQNGDISSKLFDDLERIREGISSKFSLLSQYASTFVSGFIVGCCVSIKLTAVLLIIGPIIIGITSYLSIHASSSVAREQLKYAAAGRIAEQAITAIRTIAAFGLEKKEIARYKAALKEGRTLAIHRYRQFSCGLGSLFLMTYVGYGIAFYYGANLVKIGEATPGIVFTVFFSVMAGAFSVGNALPYLNTVATAVGIANNLYDVIDRIPQIDSYSKKGLKPNKVTGKIEVKNVSFRYPSRPEIKVLENLNLTIEPGKTVALVGSSGAGKSTIVGLLLRFYDPESGKILLDSVNLSDLNVHWLRDQIGVVSQEPILFGVSIADNIRYGRENITDEELIDAAIQASAHEFIKNLPNGYNTYVGDRGCQLSGGQKQRIAIARAIVRDPKIILLDEATSALDSQSEGFVQEALDRIMKGRTTIIVAHRLSTIRNANIIHAMRGGCIVESGTHDELMRKEGLYYSLVMTQIKEQNEDKNIKAEESNANDAEYEKYEIGENLDIENSDNKEKLKKKSKSVMYQLLKYNSPEWVFLLFGTVGCILNGVLTPVYAYFYGEVFESLALTGEDLERESIFWSLMFVLIGVLSGITIFCQVWCFTFASEKLMMRMRSIAFLNILRQSVGWFDNKDSSPGNLITKLARDAPVVKAAGGMRIAQVIAASVTLLAAIGIAMIFGWKLAIVLMLSVPVLIGASYQQQMIQRKHQRRDAKFMDEAGRIASECVQNVRTVQSLGKEKTFSKLYLESLQVPYKEAKKQVYWYAMLFALSQSVTYLLYAIAFKYGSYLVLKKEMTPSAVYRVFFALSFSAQSVGLTMAFLQDYAKAKLSAKIMFNLMESPSEIDSQSTKGLKPDIYGKVSFKDVHFSYPTRKANKVLNGMEFSLNPGKTLALVGESGCGKSTVISLLERFYLPSSGQIEVDDCDIKHINLQHLRQNIGIVTQEPILFDCSIKDNILYGAYFNENSSLEFSRIVEAAKKANAHDFIMSLPQGYDTFAGERGTQISGGQKQRIAIARALVRDPKILLLDEATSALDTESEKVVQEALDQARIGRTCIIIAHRLSTIITADEIAVVKNGKIVEHGTHQELQNLKGFYYELVKRQQL